MRLGYSFGHASGIDKRRCHVIGYRYPASEGFSAERGESYVVEFDGPDVRTRYKSRWLTGLWRSKCDKVYVTDAGRAVIHLERGAAAPIADHKLEFSPFGIWGLDDEHVYAWGRSGNESRLGFWGGTKWVEMAAPRLPVIALHGTSPGLLFAVGDDGFIARWDGSRWNEMAAPASYSLCSVFVVSEDEVYACAGVAGRLLQGSIRGWAERLRVGEDIGAVAKWGGKIWIACHGGLGLCRLDEDRLNSVKPKLQAETLDHRGQLLLSISDKIVATDDGKKFAGFPVSDFEQLVRGNFPVWED